VRQHKYILMILFVVSACPSDYGLKAEERLSIAKENDSCQKMLVKTGSRSKMMELVMPYSHTMTSKNVRTTVVAVYE
jgi:hypothetical protein